MKQVIVTSSWDDGHKLDVRLAKLLKKYNLPGTFYISPHDKEFDSSDLLTPNQTKTISHSFEIGAHTITHPRLSKVSDAEANKEIVDSKKYLEKLTGHKISSFCYPGGDYRRRHLAMVRSAGFKYARTVRRHSYDLKSPMLEAQTTVNTYNHYQDLWKIFRFAKFSPRKTIRYFQWDNLAKAMFDRVLDSGGVYHLWGHSWEVDSHKDWDKLESVFKYIANRSGVNYVTNRQLVQLQPKNLLITAPYFPPHHGGQEYYALNIGQRLQKEHGWKVIVATSGNRGWQMKVSDYQGLRVYRLPYLLKISNTPLHPLWAFWIRKIIKRENISIINAHAPVPLFADVTVRVAKDTPVIVTYHMQSMKKGRVPADWLIEFYERYVLPKTLQKADSIICASDQVRDTFLKRFLDKSETITPGVDDEFYVPAKERPDNTILFVGSLNKSDDHKGLKYLLEALDHIVKNSPAVQLLVVGPGTGRRNFEILTEKLGLSDHVKFLGGKDGPELKKIYQQATIFVLPSLNDNFPLVILEAMSSGLPVISTLVGSIPTLVEEGRTGYVVAPADSGALTEKLDYLLKHSDVAREFGVRGRQKIEKALTWQIQAEKTTEVLRAAVYDE